MTINDIIQDVFENIVILNSRGRCKKDSYKAGTFECDPADSDIEEKPKSSNDKKVYNDKVNDKKISKSTHSAIKDLPIPDAIDVIMKSTSDMNTFCDYIDTYISKLPVNDINNIAKEYERKMRAPGYEKIPFDEYQKLSLVYGTAKDIAKNASLSKPKINKNIIIKTIDDAKREIGVEDIWFDGKKPKVSVIKALNGVAKERNRLIESYPNLQKVNIKFMSFPDESFEKDKIDGHYIAGTISLRSKLPSTERETKTLDGGVLIRGVGISGAYRHELGHAAEDQLFTKEEKDDISKMWKKIVEDDRKNGSFSGNSMKKEIEYAVSKYATTGPMEMVAEMFCEMAKGKNYPDGFFPEVQKPIKRILFGGK